MWAAWSPLLLLYTTHINTCYVFLLLLTTHVHHIVYLNYHILYLVAISNCTQGGLATASFKDMVILHSRTLPT